jgi:hypothetical protein
VDDVSPWLEGADGWGGSGDTWRGRTGVELGAGLGLPTIVAAKLGVSMVATDGEAGASSDCLLTVYQCTFDRPGPLQTVCPLCTSAHSIPPPLKARHLQTVCSLCTCKRSTVPDPPFGPAPVWFAFAEVRFLPPARTIHVVNVGLSKGARRTLDFLGHLRETLRSLPPSNTGSCEPALAKCLLSIVPGGYINHPVFT